MQKKKGGRESNPLPGPNPPGPAHKAQPRLPNPPPHPRYPLPSFLPPPSSSPPPPPELGASPRRPDDATSLTRRCRPPPRARCHPPASDGEAAAFPSLPCSRSLAPGRVPPANVAARSPCAAVGPAVNEGKGRRGRRPLRGWCGDTGSAVIPASGRGWNPAPTGAGGTW